MIVNIYKNDFKITFDDLFFFGGGYYYIWWVVIGLVLTNDQLGGLGGLVSVP
jgi:hypothetical protein